MAGFWPSDPGRAGWKPRGLGFRLVQTGAKGAFGMRLWCVAVLAALMLAQTPARADETPRAKYEAYAQTCRSTQGTDGSNPCRDALWFYGGTFGRDDLSEPLALLQENCRAGGRITGCGPLHSFYSGDEFLFSDGSRQAWPPQPDKAFAAARTGCVATLEGVSLCGSLGLAYERQGDFAAAGRAYATGCDTGMTAGPDDYYGQGRVCQWAAKNARDNLHDYARARDWFGYVCTSAKDPWACKFLGLMQAQAEGGPADPLAALNLYAQGCNMVEDIASGDGQACFLFGQSLSRLHDRVVPGDGGYRPRGNRPATSGANLTNASRAFLRGCMDDRAEACRAHDALLKDWAQGGYPRVPQPCRVLGADGTAGPEKRCQLFAFYLRAPEGADDKGEAAISVWPDGDRTVVLDHAGPPRLNGATGGWVLFEDAWECVRNTATGRAFCFQS